MPKNIIIFSDGTGQRGGQFFDERRSNIYKLYRATRCGPDSTVDPEKQLAFYDPGLGTLPEVGNTAYRIYRKLYNLVGQATGLGITANIVDGYAAVVQMWQPGDRIFLIGFSRGAYTVRCLAAVLRFCGVPTTMDDGTELKRDEGSVRKIARRAVKKVYQHVSSPRDAKYLGQRHELARQFRNTYRSDRDGGSNAHPYFIGVFDTVASLASYPAIALTIGIIAAALLGGSYALSFFAYSFGFWLKWLAISAAVAAFVSYLWTHVKFAFGLPGFSFWQTLHLNAMKMKFYDRRLDDNVGYARHALAIDEYRKDFDRVEWGQRGEWRNTGEGNPIWFEQLWFAGSHSDIGGSYAENESRLSDTALKWMVDEASRVPDGIIVDEAVLRLFPSHKGMQHDESRSGLFKYASTTVRKIATEAKLHPSVLERLKEEKVLHSDQMRPWRPEALRRHVDLAAYYPAPTGEEKTVA